MKQQDFKEAARKIFKQGGEKPEMLYFGLSVALLSIGMIGYVSLLSTGTEHILENVGRM